MASSTESLHDGDSPLAASALKETIAAPLSAVAFWSAIALPALYLPLLAAGIEGGRGLTVFLGLFALHVVTLLAGRSYPAGQRQ